jgi:mannitol 2-dehydrogenase
LFVADVKPYEAMKLRLLNGGHSALAYLSFVHGHERVDKATRDAIIQKFIKAYMEEVTPTVPHVPGVDLEAYKAKLIERFSNTQLSDQVSRLCEDGSKKMVNFIGPCIQHKLANGGDFKCLSLAVAGWIRYLGGKT